MSAVCTNWSRSRSPTSVAVAICAISSLCAARSRACWKTRSASYSIDGKLYALESDTCLSVLYYREDEFKKNDIPADVATWEELVEIGARLHKKTGQSLGGGYFDQSGNLTLDSPEAVEVLDSWPSASCSG
ncbi:extracellular solute-binding protein [Nonomuraea jabiensis]|uniref:extracellular solute-binding protein n=1 Tax=Nonomuraea jabiensis TaxID=882448 RepID=UPI003D74217E